MRKHVGCNGEKHFVFCELLSGVFRPQQLEHGLNHVGDVVQVILNMALQNKE